MNRETQHQARAMESEIESSRVTAPLAPIDEASSVDQETVQQLISEIDLENSNSIISFGSSAQSELQTISQSMLSGVRNKDTGPSGDALRSMVTTIRGFEINEDETRTKRSCWERLLGRAVPFVKFTARFETVQSQIDRISDELLHHEHVLMKDIKSLDKLYEKSREFYLTLALYIGAGEKKLAEIDSTDIPAMEQAVAKADANEQVMRAQELRDMRAARDDLERRVHDLRLTRQVTMQSLPSIRLVQENDKSLVGKINATLTNTVPLWETQIAQALTIQRSAEAAKSVADANDLTNELLTSNAANLRDSNARIRTEMERGVFDIEAVKRANEDLVGTIEDSLMIAEEGKRARREAESELTAMEERLKQTFAAATSGETALAR